ncbi:MAG: hypothetical protein KZQ58_03690 [gamma proteobacterium symbiont of Bathyaustriella thionipta]|nr:hypothetical protein [gamma proteobacterium symbiont of Bathyaustriella thionipta]
MDSNSIELPGSQIEEVSLQNDQLSIVFSRVHIIKSMTGAEQKTRWYQAGKLVFSGIEETDGIPQCPCICSGGDVGENIYTYRDMIPLPLKSQGHTHCSLIIEGQDARLQVQAEAVELQMIDTPRYIEHFTD